MEDLCSVGLVKFLKQRPVFRMHHAWIKLWLDIYNQYPGSFYDRAYQISDTVSAFCFLLSGGFWGHILSSVNAHEGWNGVQLAPGCPKSSPGLQLRNVCKVQLRLPSLKSWVCCSYLGGGCVNEHILDLLSISLSSLDENVFKFCHVNAVLPFKGLLIKDFPWFHWKSGEEEIKWLCLMLFDLKKIFAII